MTNDTLEQWYTDQVNHSQLIFDQIQLSIVKKLDEFIIYFKKNSLFKLWLTPPQQGYYICGRVGRGKSMLMDQFYALLPQDKKLRIHFHQFMQEVHEKLAKLKETKNPLKEVAHEFYSKYKIICLDEMHVNDIATAMILKNLFTELLAHIYIVTTSNFLPEELYPNGLMRERFLPAIEIISQKLKVLKLDGDEDYRLARGPSNGLFFINHDNNQEALSNLFDQINTTSTYRVGHDVVINTRPINFVRCGKKIIWFDFDIICGGTRSQIDYLELVAVFDWFIISNIHSISSKENDIARRFIWLIDVLYDSRCKLIIGSNIPLDQIYISDELNSEFKRTLSRLNEMQSSEYISRNRLKQNTLAET